MCDKPQHLMSKLGVLGPDTVQCVMLTLYIPPLLPVYSH